MSKWPLPFTLSARWAGACECVFVGLCVYVSVALSVWLFATPWTVALQALCSCVRAGLGRDGSTKFPGMISIKHPHVHEVIKVCKNGRLNFFLFLFGKRMGLCHEKRQALLCISYQELFHASVLVFSSIKWWDVELPQRGRYENSTNQRTWKLFLNWKVFCKCYHITSSSLYFCCSSLTPPSSGAKAPSTLALLFFQRVGSALQVAWIGRVGWEVTECEFTSWLP